MRVLILLLSLSLTKSQFSQSSFGQCDSCYCIPQPGANCPKPVPETNFTDLIPTLKKYALTNPIELECNPYKNSACMTEPPLEQGGTCVVDLKPSEAVSCSDGGLHYALRTVKDLYEEAIMQGLIVTHAGACGVCSSLNDLAVMMEQGPNLREASAKCGARGLISRSDGIHCFQQLGFSQSCASIYLFQAVNTDAKCYSTCPSFVISGAPANGPAPSCTLAECLQCDNSESGALLSRFAGRGRRNSGLLSDIARPCSQIDDIQQADPCTVSPESSSERRLVPAVFYRSAPPSQAPGHAPGVVSQKPSSISVVSPSDMPSDMPSGIEAKPKQVNIPAPEAALASTSEAVRFLDTALVTMMVGASMMLFYVI